MSKTSGKPQQPQSMSYEGMKDYFQELTRLRIDFLNFYHLSNYLILPLTKPGASIGLLLVFNF